MRLRQIKEKIVSIVPSILRCLFLVWLIVFSFLVLGRIWVLLNRGKPQPYPDESAIQVMLDMDKNAMSSTEFIGVVFHYGGSPFILNYRQANVVAWFRCDYADVDIVVNYLYFPSREDYRGRSLDKTYKQFRQLSVEIGNGSGIPDTHVTKQIKVALPVGLRDDGLFKKMSQYSKAHENMEKTGITDGPPEYHFGFKTNSMRFTDHSRDYTCNYYRRHHKDYVFYRDHVEKEILEPIMMKILYHETPLEWKMEVIKRLMEEGIKDADLEILLSNYGMVP